MFDIVIIETTTVMGTRNSASNLHFTITRTQKRIHWQQYVLNKCSYTMEMICTKVKTFSKIRIRNRGWNLYGVMKSRINTSVT